MRVIAAASLAILAAGSPLGPTAAPPVAPHQPQQQKLRGHHGAASAPTHVEPRGAAEANGPKVAPATPARATTSTHAKVAALASAHRVVGSGSGAAAKQPIEPPLLPESDKVFWKEDYPHDWDPPAGFHGTRPGGMYPAFQSDNVYDKDYVKDENGDNGEWGAQARYDTLRVEVHQSKKRADGYRAEAQMHQDRVDAARATMDAASAAAAAARRRADAARARAKEIRDTLARLNGAAPGCTDRSGRKSAEMNRGDMTGEDMDSAIIADLGNATDPNSSVVVAPVAPVDNATIGKRSSANRTSGNGTSESPENSTVGNATSGNATFGNASEDSYSYVSATPSMAPAPAAAAPAPAVAGQLLEVDAPLMAGAFAPRPANRPDCSDGLIPQTEALIIKLEVAITECEGQTDDHIQVVMKKKAHHKAQAKIVEEERRKALQELELAKAELAKAENMSYEEADPEFALLTSQDAAMLKRFAKDERNYEDARRNMMASQQELVDAQAAMRNGVVRLKSASHMAHRRASALLQNPKGDLKAWGKRVGESGATAAGFAPALVALLAAVAWAA